MVMDHPEINDFCDVPQKPVKPLDKDCCGNGCDPCIFDIYDQEIKIWEKECKKKQRNIKGNSGKCQGPPLSVNEYRQFWIISVTNDTANTYRYKLALPEDVSLGISTGQHIIIRGFTKGEPVTRQYTPISDVIAEGYFELLIKVYSQGKMSKLVKDWNVGTSVDIRGPLGSFGYKANEYSHVYMLAAGTGITPMAQIIQTVLSNPDDETFLVLVYACRTYKDIHLKAELNEWAGYWNFKVVYALSQEDPEKPSAVYRYSDKIHFGRITETFLKTDIVNSSHRSQKFLICGSKSFEQDMTDKLKKIIPDTEYFIF